MKLTGQIALVSGKIQKPNWIITKKAIKEMKLPKEVPLKTNFNENALVIGKCYNFRKHKGKVLYDVFIDKKLIENARKRKTGPIPRWYEEYEVMVNMRTVAIAPAMKCDTDDGRISNINLLSMNFTDIPTMRENIVR